jgi:kynurenine formamidase
LVSAAQCVRLGKVVSLALPVGANLAPAWRHRFTPEYRMLRSRSDIEQDLTLGNQGMSVSDDALTFPLQSSTHWDALSHVFHNGYMYNGKQPDVLSDAGAAFGSITTAANGFAGRGVLLDIPLVRGVPHLEIGDTVEADDLQQACEMFGITLQAGDFVIVRTGRLGLAVTTGSWGSEWSGGPNAGLGFSTIAWLANHDVAAVACDNFSVEVIPAQTADFGQRAPLHSILVHGCGIYLGEMWFLEELHDVARETGQYAFLLVAPPMVVAGAVGAPCNPQAIF